jgi:hypothetical protein
MFGSLSCWDCHASNKAQVFEMLKDELENLSKDFPKKPVYSMPKRCADAIANKVHWAKH